MAWHVSCVLLIIAVGKMATGGSSVVPSSTSVDRDTEEVSRCLFGCCPHHIDIYVDEENRERNVAPEF